MKTGVGQSMNESAAGEQVNFCDHLRRIWCRVGIPSAL